MTDKVDRKLDELLQKDIIEVVNSLPTKWVSHVFLLYPSQAMILDSVWI